MKKVMVTGLLALSVGAACAQVYVGAGLGVTQFNMDCTGAETCDSTSSGGKFYAGYAFNPNVAAEVGYLDFGTAKSSGYVYSYYYGYYLLHLDMNASAVTAALALGGALSPNVSVVGRLGVAQVKVTGKAYVTGSSTVVSHSETKTKPYVGAALEYAFSKNLKGTLSADFTEGENSGEKGSLRMAGVGLQYGF